MPGKIFISCGQLKNEERQIATEISKWLRRKGFDPYVAIQTQSIQDVNSGIIGKLKEADYYIFIDFKREKIGRAKDRGPEYRGSLFTHQELAITYLLGFKNAIFLRERNVRLEGIGQYLLTNADSFRSKDDVLPLIRKKISRLGWYKDYSRHFVVSISNSGQWSFSDHTGSFNQHIWQVIVENRRDDIAAFNTVARLSRITLPRGIIINSPDTNFLKWAGKHQTYSTTILQGDSAKFDCVALDINHPSHVYLHSELDTIRHPIINTTGLYLLHYQILAVDFPIFEFTLEMDLTNNVTSTVLRLR